MTPIPFLAVLAILSSNFAVVSASNHFLNVFGDSLQPCSYDGTALTGYTRNGYCVHENDDEGSHHVCIELPEDDDDDDNNNENFCTVTGQSNWCSSEDLPCHDDASDESCSIVNWCVCQWAFASYIDKVGDCDQIETIVCESVNLRAVKAYVKLSLDNPKYTLALECLASRCDLDLSNEELYGTPASRLDLRLREVGKHMLGPLVVLMSVLLSAIYIYRTRRQCMECAGYEAWGESNKKQHLLDDRQKMDREHDQQSSLTEISITPTPKDPPSQTTSSADPSSYRLA